MKLLVLSCPISCWCFIPLGWNPGGGLQSNRNWNSRNIIVNTVNYRSVHSPVNTTVVYTTVLHCMDKVLFFLDKQTCYAPAGHIKWWSGPDLVHGPRVWQTCSKRSAFTPRWTSRNCLTVMFVAEKKNADKNAEQWGALQGLRLWQQCQSWLHHLQEVEGEAQRAWRWYTSSHLCLN